MTTPRDESRTGLNTVALGIGAVAVIAIVLLGIVMFRPDDGTTGMASPTASPAASSSALPTSSAEPSEPQETPASSPSAAASAGTPTGMPESWTDIATFSEAGKRYILGDLTARSGGGLIAVGTRWEEEFRSVFGPPPPRSGRVWTSTDGTAWTDVTPSGTFADFELTHVYEAADGALIVIGDSWPGMEPVSAAWESTDGVTWQPLTLDGIPSGLQLSGLVRGAQGWLATVSGNGYVSSDGRAWEATFENAVTVGAGDEGFVAVVLREEAGEQVAAVVASSDGVNWFDAASPAGDTYLVAPHAGGDWVAIGAEYGDDFIAKAWRSENGLDWAESSAVPLADVDVGGDTTCQEAPGSLSSAGPLLVLGMTLLGPCSEGGVIAAGGSIGSLDGITWSRLPFGDRASAVVAVVAGDRIVVGTDARTNSAPTNGITFWIGSP